MIECSNLKCKYRNDKNGKCECKKLKLVSWTVNTTNMGFKDYLECKSFEEDEEYNELKNTLKELGIL